MKNRILKLFAVLLLGMNWSCTDWLTIQPETQLTTEDMFKTKGGFNDALNGVYIGMLKLYRYDGDIIAGLVEHLACQWDGIKPESIEEKMNLHDYYDLDGRYAAIFKALYLSISDVNIILKYIDNGVLTERDYELTKGQLLALRGFLHFELIRIWGPMPKNPDQGKLYLPYVKTLQTTPYQYVRYYNYMQQLNADLNEAEKLLKSSFILGLENPSYMKCYQLYAIKARLALWENDKENAIKYAKLLYDYTKTSYGYKLGTINDINAGDLILSREHIFRVSQVLDDALSTQSKTFLYDEYLTEDLFKDNYGDIRLMPWEYDVNQQDKMAKKCKKYYVKPADQNADENAAKPSIKVPLIRLAEIYLILIETLDIAEANKIYQQFCLARGANFTPFYDQGQRQVTLISEYRKEFIMEGQLFFAYKRMGIKNMPRCIRPCSADAYVLPIPRREIDVNE